MISNLLLDYVNICTDTCTLKENSNSIRIVSASSKKAGETISPADFIERTARHDLYEL